MAFHEVLFPTTISKGSKLASQFRHSILEAQSGAIATIARWPNPLWAFDVGFGIRAHRSFADVRTVYDFWIARDGHSHGFRFENPFEHSTASDHIGAPDDEDETLGTAVAGQTQFQLIKTYTDTIGTKTRVITKPKAGSVVVAEDTVNTTAFTVDTSSGIITMDSAPGAGVVVTAGCEFDLPCQFGPQMQGLDMQIESTAGEAIRAPSIPIVEMAGEVVTPEQYPRGGASAQSFSTDLIYDFSMGATVVLTPSTSGLDLILPTITDLADGGPHLHLINASATDSIGCRNRTDNTTEFTIAADTGAQVFVVTVSGSKTWEALSGTS
jgi:uncharacterized protein (TIGR02217 family)